MHLKVGDLVKFVSGVRTWRVDYLHRNPGIEICSFDTHSRFGSAHVLWSNGDRTTEHASYLEVINEI